MAILIHVILGKAEPEVDGGSSSELSDDVEAIADHLTQIVALAGKHHQLAVIAESAQTLLDALL